MFNTSHTGAAFEAFGTCLRSLCRPRHACSIAAAVTVLASMSSAIGATLRVPGDHSTIQAAIDAANNGDTILVAPGTYVERITLDGKNIKLMAETSACGTVIDGSEPDIFNQFMSVVTCEGEPATALIQGFTITGGTGSLGAGISFADGSQITVRDCIIRENNTQSFAGGVFIDDASPKLIDCEIIDNSSTNAAGGVGALGGGGIFRRCLIRGNTANQAAGMDISLLSTVALVETRFENNHTVGGGVCQQPGICGSIGGGLLIGNANTQVVNCAFVGNSGHSGGGVFVQSGRPLFVNCLFVENEANWGGGAFLNNLSDATFINCTIADNLAYGNEFLQPGGGVHTISPNLNIRNSILWGNTLFGGAPSQIEGNGSATVTYSTVQGGWPGQDNLSSNPGFVNPGANNYRLVAGSTAVNSGLNSYLPADQFDLDGDSNFSENIPLDLGRIQREVGVVDMGAYECLINPCTGQCVEVMLDCNNNGVPDDCDIAAETSEDCNGNGIPDECEDNATMEVAFILDGSGSISKTAWEAQTLGIVDCLCGPEAIIPHDGSATISVIQFSDNICADLWRVQVTSSSHAQDLCDHIATIDRDSAGTVLAPAIQRAIEAFQASNAVRRNVFIATDAILGSQDEAESLTLCETLRTSLGTRVCTALVDLTGPNAFLEECANADGAGSGIQGSFSNVGSPEDFGELCVDCIDSLDDCKCPGDIDDDGNVGVSDLLALLAAWGPCADPQDCPADLTGDGNVGVSDLLIVLGNWGPCSSKKAISPPPGVLDCYSQYSHDPVLLERCLDALPTGTGD